MDDTVTAPFQSQVPSPSRVGRESLWHVLLLSNSSKTPSGSRLSSFFKVKLVANSRPRRHLRTPTVVWGPRSAPRGPPTATPPTFVRGAPPTPSRFGSKASINSPQASLPTRRTLVPRSPRSLTTQVRVSVSCAASQPTRAVSRRSECQHQTPSSPQKVSLSPSSGRTTLILWSICVRCCALCATLSRAFTSFLPRPPPQRPTEPAPLARWYPMELRPPTLLPPRSRPHRLTHPKAPQPQLFRQEQPRLLASSMECTPSQATL